MDKKQIIIIGVVGAGAYVAYSLFRSSYASASEDPYGNPEGTLYDEEGMPEAPLFLVPAGESETAAQAEGSALSIAERSHTVPAAEAGGLRNHSASPWLDSRFTAYGQLSRPLAAKDTELFVQDQPGFWVIACVRGICPRPMENTPPTQPYQLGKVYRLLIEEEPIVAMCMTHVGARRECQFRIMDRPHMSNWNGPTPSYRQFTTDAQMARWPQYADTSNPVYYPIVTDEVRARWMHETGIVFPPSWPTWVTEQKANCSHDEWRDLGQYRVWDPVLGDCRAMTDAERAAHIAWLEAREREEAAAVEAGSIAREETCQRNWGISCAEFNRFGWFQGITPPTDDESRARVQALPERTDFSFPADIDQWFPQYGPSGHRALPFSMSDETMVNRRERGRALYAAMPMLTKNEFQRDFFSLRRFGFRLAGRRYPGEDIIKGIGGFHGMASIWGAPDMAMVYAEPVAAPPLMLRRT